MSVSALADKVLHLEVPQPTSQKDRLVYGLFGLLNCVFFGTGMIMLGYVENDATDMIIGVLQLLCPIVGWIWAIFWGALIVLKAFTFKGDRNPV